MTDSVSRATQLALKDLNPELISTYLQQAEVLEEWIKDLRALAHQMVESDVVVPGYKLVAKRAVRSWVSEDKTIVELVALGLQLDDLIEESIISPAVAEKLLKKQKKELPKELVNSISSGSTLVEESDPRPAMLQIGKQISAALSKLN